VVPDLETLNVSLFITSLEAAYVGRTDSGRPIITVKLEDRLDDDGVTTIWVNTLDSRIIPGVQKVSATELYALKLVAATVNDIPRFVEFVNDHFRKLPSSVIDGEVISNTYVKLFQKICNWYSLKKFSVTDNILIAVILNRKIRMDNPELIAAITNSLITNTITVFGPKEYLSRYQVSLVMMLVMLRDDDDLSPFGVTVRKLLFSIFMSLKESYEDFKRKASCRAHISGRKSNQKNRKRKASCRAHISGRKSNPKDHIDEGLLLEKIVRYWLQLKLAAAAAGTFSKEADGITLLQLLSLNDELIIPEEYQELFLTPLFFHKYIPAVQLRYNSWKTNVLFLEELQDVQCGELASRLKWTHVVVLIPHKDYVKLGFGSEDPFPGGDVRLLYTYGF